MLARGRIYLGVYSEGWEGVVRLGGYDLELILEYLNVVGWVTISNEVIIKIILRKKYVINGLICAE